MFANPIEIINCQQAAREVRKVLGPLAVHGPHLGEFVRCLESCEDSDCEGGPRIAVILEAATAVNQDSVLALLN